MVFIEGCHILLGVTTPIHALIASGKSIHCRSQQKCFNENKWNIRQALSITLLDFQNHFEVKVDANRYVM